MFSDGFRRTVENLWKSAEIVGFLALCKIYDYDKLNLVLISCWKRRVKTNNKVVMTKLAKKGRILVKDAPNYCVYSNK